MANRFSGLRSGMALLAALWLSAGAAQAEPVALSPGPVQLATSGLVIDVPAKAGVRFRLSSSWSFDVDENSYDGRDVIDEFATQTDKLTAGNWVLTGYFDAGDCGALLAGEQLESDWTQDAKLWGGDWKVRGGVHDLGGAIGRAPTVVLCRSDASGRSLLLYRYMLDQPLSLDRPGMMKQVEGADILQSAWKSYRDGRTADVTTTRRPEVTNRGANPPNYLTELPVTGLQVQLPDDGYVWLAREGDGSDMIDRMAPSLPDVSVEVALADKVGCTELFAALTDSRRANHKANAAPPGWIIGDAMQIGGETELLLCRTASYGTLLVGVMQGPDRTDIAYLFPLLAALDRATLAQ